jgi:hypothetical protein
MPETKITLYTDVISPFGYLAWHILNVRPFKTSPLTYMCQGS